MVETECEEDDEDERSWRVFRSDLVRDIARMALRKDRGRRVGKSIGILGRAVGIPLEEDAVGYLGDVISSA